MIATPTTTLPSPDNVLESITEGTRLFGVQLDDQAATAFEGDTHDNAPALLGDLQRTVTSPRLHRRHAAPHFPSVRADLVCSGLAAPLSPMAPLPRSSGTHLQSGGGGGGATGKARCRPESPASTGVVELPGSAGGAGRRSCSSANRASRTSTSDMR